MLSAYLSWRGRCGITSRRTGWPTYGPTRSAARRCWKVERGRVIDDLRHFLGEALGNPTVTDAEMQAKWSALMAELSRVLGLGTQLVAVREVCDKVEASGAPKYAAICSNNRLAGTVDGLLPDNWRKAWRLRRLITYLESIDAHEDLKKLARDRHDVESDLSQRL